MDLQTIVNFEKADSRGRYVRGWAYVCKDKGGDVVDFSGQVVDIEVVREAAHEFIADQRISKVLHGKDFGMGGVGERAIGEIIESLIIDDAVAKALGMSDARRGWWIGVRVDDATVQKRIRDGELKAFSIGGRGRVEELKAAA